MSQIGDPKMVISIGIYRKEGPDVGFMREGSIYIYICMHACMYVCRYAYIYIQVCVYVYIERFSGFRAVVSSLRQANGQEPRMTFDGAKAWVEAQGGRLMNFHEARPRMRPS